MLGEKSIVIGCDHTASLSALMRCLKEKSDFPFTHIAATRISDLLNIVRYNVPDLVILCFRNNQLALDDFCNSVRNMEIPVICLSSKTESETLRWNRNLSAFTYSLEHITHKDYLRTRIQSVLQLRTASLKKTKRPESLKENYWANTNTKDLSRFVLELDQKAEVLLRVKERIEALYESVDNPTRTELLSIVNTIKKSSNNKKIWDDFKLYFELSNPDFLLELAKKHPVLTPKDLKYCCYLKMNMSNDDIRNLLGINQESVRTHKYRLKKKMDLPKDADLIHYLLSVENSAHLPVRA